MAKQQLKLLHEDDVLENQSRPRPSQRYVYVSALRLVQAIHTGLYVVNSVQFLKFVQNKKLKHIPSKYSSLVSMPS